ncbi:MAG: hypothetical protein K0S80_2904 [Neobacillus sp.]|jgi:hypothetical protein|nr:hypothetical protein [Neobacillus sp.]
MATIISQLIVNLVLFGITVWIVFLLIKSLIRYTINEIKTQFNDQKDEKKL